MDPLLALVLIALLVALYSVVRTSRVLSGFESALRVERSNVKRLQALAAQRGPPILQSDYEKLRYWP